MNALLIGSFVVLAIGFGAIASLVGGLLAVALLVALAPVPFIFRNYRIGVVCLTVALPFVYSKLLPQVSGLNVFTYLLLATAGSFFMQAIRNKDVIAVPGTVVWGFLLPITVGIVLAWPHVPEGARNYNTEFAMIRYVPFDYFKNSYLKPVAYFVGYAVLLANAIRSSDKPQRYLAALYVSALLPTFLVMYKVATYGNGISALVNDREFLTSTGTHANEFGLMLALAMGPLLFTSGVVAHRGLRFVARVAMALVLAGLILTFSRGGLLAFLIVVALYLWQRRQLKVAIGIAVVSLMILVVLPDAVTERFGAGVRSGAVSDMGNIEKDELTAGRFVGWEMLAPEVLRSPIWGRGIGSTAWSEAVAKGKFKPDHPHNMYLETLMDLGFAGLFAFIFVFNRYLAGFKRLARDESFSPLMQNYFWGARASLLGALVMAFTTGYYMPNPAQTPLWFSLGLLFAYWNYGKATATDAAKAKLGSREAVMAALGNHRSGRFLRGLR